MNSICSGHKDDFSRLTRRSRAPPTRPAYSAPLQVPAAFDHLRACSDAVALWLVGSSMVSPLGQGSLSHHGTPRSHHGTPRARKSLALNPRQLNFDVTNCKPCASMGVSLDYGRNKPERRLDKHAPADKPGVSLPGEATTAWARDPKLYLEYSDQYAKMQRPGRGQRLKTAEDRAELPYCRAKIEKKEDGAYAKPLVGYRSYQGPAHRQPTAARLVCVFVLPQ